jgi:hypothetical protein
MSHFRCEQLLLVPAAVLLLEIGVVRLNKG